LRFESAFISIGWTFVNHPAEDADGQPQASIWARNALLADEPAVTLPANSDIDTHQASVSGEKNATCEFLQRKQAKIDDA
jgi:hypothetical protein